jgi:hypothetical protein
MFHLLSRHDDRSIHGDFLIRQNTKLANAVDFLGYLKNRYLPRHACTSSEGDASSESDSDQPSETSLC